MKHRIETYRRGIKENERFIKKIGKGDGQIAAMRACMLPSPYRMRRLKNAWELPRMREWDATSTWPRDAATGKIPSEVPGWQRSTG